jgi:hypothetical protein
MDPRIEAEMRAREVKEATWPASKLTLMVDAKIAGFAASEEEDGTVWINSRLDRRPVVALRIRPDGIGQEMGPAGGLSLTTEAEIRRYLGI